MPVYEFFCPTCKSPFEMLRSMSAYDQDADCPACATRSRKTLSVFATVNRISFDEFAPMCATDGAMGGGCACGGACMHGA